MSGPVASDREVPGTPSFRHLQARLREIWHAIERGAPIGHTSVIVPSLSFDVDELEKIQGIAYYEERLLFSLIRLRDPRARLIYVTSQPVHPEIVDYYIGLLRGVPPSSARSRLLLIGLADGSPRPLTRKILERPRVIRRIREAVGDPRRAYLTVFNATELERDLAVALGIPLNGVDPALNHLGTKSGSRRAFREAGVPCAAGAEGLRTREEVEEALLALREARPTARRAVVKLDESFAGAGNAVFEYPDPLPGEPEARRAAISDALDRLRLATPDETPAGFLARFARMGGIVEEFLSAPGLRSPSVQVRIDPDRRIHALSSHEQVLGGPLGQTYLGCRFPAEDDYRRPLQERALAVAAVLRDHGVVGRFAVDFLAWPDPDAGGWSFSAVEINLRLGGTTAPFLALQFLTGGMTEPETGLFRAANGRRKFYFATDNLRSPRYQGLLPEDFSEILARRQLLFDPHREVGPVFHMMGALSQFGKVGVTCIGDAPEEAERIYERVVRVLDEEGAEHDPLAVRHPYELPIEGTISSME